ncbi:MAG: helix-turn-helix transcriptional regulator [Clostridia bacterium]|nr:helix-turn-helix transcriptional regulator [Clostridia bacterium]
MEHNVPSQDIWNKLFYYLDMKITYNNKFPERLKELRLEMGFSRQELATKLNVSVRLLSYWENGQRECNFDALIALSNELNCSIDYLLGKSDF